MKTIIILVNTVTDLPQGRNFVENIPTKFQNEKSLYEYINNKVLSEHFKLLPISDFIDLSNDSCIDLDNFWLGYSNISE